MDLLAGPCQAGQRAGPHSRLITNGQRRRGSLDGQALNSHNIPTISYLILYNRLVCLNVDM